MKQTICAAMLSACALSGCGTASNQLLGVPPTLQQSSLVADATSQNQMVEALIAKAGFPAGTRLEVGSPQWKYVAQAGLLEVDLVCDRYLASLFAFNREQRAGRQILTAAGAGTAAIMGLTGAAGVSIALVAAAFGLAANVFDAGVNSVLFTIPATMGRPPGCASGEAAGRLCSRRSLASRFKTPRLNSKSNSSILSFGMVIL